MPINKKIVLEWISKVDRRSSDAVADSVDHLSKVYAKGQITTEEFAKANKDAQIKLNDLSSSFRTITAAVQAYDNILSINTAHAQNYATGIRDVTKAMQEQAHEISRQDQMLRRHSVDPSGLFSESLIRKRNAALSVLTAPERRSGAALGGGQLLPPGAFGITPTGSFNLDKAKLASRQLRFAPIISPDAMGLRPTGTGFDIDKARLASQRLRNAPTMSTGSALAKPGDIPKRGGGGSGGGGGRGGANRGFIAGHGFTSAPEFVALAGMGFAAKQMFGEAVDFDKAMAMVQSATHASSDEFDTLKNKAIEASKSSVFSASEIANGMSLLARAGLSATEIYQAITPLLQLAAGTGEDFGLVAKGVTDIIGQYNLKISDTAEVSDKLAALLMRSKADIKDLIPAFVQAGGSAHKLGLSISETNAVLEIFAGRGLKGSAAGTALRNVLLGIEDITNKKVFAKLGLAATDVNIRMHGFSNVMETLRKATLKNTEVMQIFRRRGLTPFLFLAETGKDKLDQLVRAYDMTSDAAKHMADDTTDTVTAAFQKLGHQALAPTINLLQSLKGALQGVTEGLGAAIGTEIGGGVIQFTAILTALGAVVGTATIGIKGLSRMMTALGSVQLGGAAAVTAGEAAAGGAAAGVGIGGVLSAAGIAAGGTLLAVGPAALALNYRIKQQEEANEQLEKAITLEDKVKKRQIDHIAKQIDDAKTIEDKQELLVLLETKVADLDKELVSTRETAQLRKRLTQLQSEPTYSLATPDARRLYEIDADIEATTKQLDTRPPVDEDIYAFQATALKTYQASVQAVKDLIKLQTLQTSNATLVSKRFVRDMAVAYADVDQSDKESLQTRKDAIIKNNQELYDNQVKQIEESRALAIAEIGDLDEEAQEIVYTSATDALKRAFSNAKVLLSQQLDKLDEEETKRRTKYSSEAIKYADKSFEENRYKPLKKELDKEEKAEEDAANKIKNIWEGAFNSIEGSIAGSFEAMTQSTEKFKDSLKSLPNAIKAAMVKGAAQTAASNLMSALRGQPMGGTGSPVGQGSPFGFLGSLFGGGGGGGLSSLFGGGGTTAAATPATTTPAAAGGIGAALPMLGALGLMGGLFAGGSKLGGRGSKGRNAAMGGASVAGIALAAPTFGASLLLPLAMRSMGITGGASKKKLRHRRAKQAAAMMAQVEVERQGERDRAATQLQQVFGGGLVTTEGATEIGQLLSGGISEAELQELEKGAGDTPGALGGAVGNAAVGNTVTMNNQFIIRSGLDVNKIAQALGQQISQFTPAGSFGVP